MTVGLDAGRAYRFRYLLDGQRWDNDWAADVYLPNDFGGDDSVVDLTALAEAVPRAAAHQPNPISERNNRRRKAKDDLYLDVLDAINKPLPESDGPTAREDIAAHLAILNERTLDTRAGSMLRALLAEAAAFPELHRRYFAEIVTPRREIMYRLIRRGIAAGEIRPTSTWSWSTRCSSARSWRGWDPEPPQALTPKRPAGGSPTSSSTASGPAEPPAARECKDQTRPPDAVALIQR